MKHKYAHQWLNMHVEREKKTISKKSFEWFLHTHTHD